MTCLDCEFMKKEKIEDDLEWAANLSDEALELLAIRLDAARRRMDSPLTSSGED